MIMLGYTALLDGTKNYQTPVVCDEIDKLSLTNGIFDDLYITHNITDDPTNNLNILWNWQTVLHAEFKESLLAGNVDFVLDQISKIRIKYKEHSSPDWIILDEVPIGDTNDLSFERYCKYCKGHHTLYDFALVPISPSGIEGNYNVNTVVSDFVGMYVMNLDHTYNAINVTITPTRYQNATLLNPLDGKWPVVLYPDDLNYEKLQIQCMFIEYLNNTYDKNNALEYRRKAIDLLTSKKSLLLKYEDGRMWIAAITEQPSDDSSNYNAEGYTLTNFSAIEIGDANNYDDLVDNGLIKQ